MTTTADGFLKQNNISFERYPCEIRRFTGGKKFCNKNIYDTRRLISHASQLQTLISVNITYIIYFNIIVISRIKFFFYCFCGGNKGLIRITTSKHALRRRLHSLYYM